MTNELKQYLKWRCKMNWHSRYLKSNWYLDMWMSNVTETQLQYFEREMNNLIDRNLYKPV